MSHTRTNWTQELALAVRKRFLPNSLLLLLLLLLLLFLHPSRSLPFPTSHLPPPPPRHLAPLTASQIASSTSGRLPAGAAWTTTARATGGGGALAPLLACPLPFLSPLARSSPPPRFPRARPAPRWSAPPPPPFLLLLLRLLLLLSSLLLLLPSLFFQAGYHPLAEDPASPLHRRFSRFLSYTS
eukprot:755064-Hanusia_phi.AAC.1